VQTQTQLTVYSLAFVGLFAYAARSELVNTAPLTGTALTASLAAVGVYNTYSVANAAVAASCALATPSDSAVVTVSAACVASVGSAHQGGSAAVPVTVSYGALAPATVRLRVWFPTSVAVTVSTGTLAQINPACGRFQETALTAMATFAAGPAEEVSPVTADVTRLVGFTSSDAAVVVVAAVGYARQVARGVGPGTASVALHVAAPTNPGLRLGAAATVVVAAAAAPVLGLKLAVFTGATWATAAAGDPQLEDAVTPQLQFAQSLVAEGNTARVAVYAAFKDGTTMDVTAEARIKSLSPNSVAVVTNSSLIVPVRPARRAWWRRATPPASPSMPRSRTAPPWT
jgi:hypothetical protein